MPEPRIRPICIRPGCRKYLKRHPTTGEVNPRKRYCDSSCRSRHAYLRQQRRQRRKPKPSLADWIQRGQGAEKILEELLEEYIDRGDPRVAEVVAGARTHFRQISDELELAAKRSRRYSRKVGRKPVSKRIPADGPLQGATAGDRPGP